VQLGVDEHGGTEVSYPADDPRSLSHEEPQPDLEPPDVGLEIAGKPDGFVPCC
jgi:hypothetical protein